MFKYNYKFNDEEIDLVINSLRRAQHLDGELLELIQRLEKQREKWNKREREIQNYKGEYSVGI